MGKPNRGAGVGNTRPFYHRQGGAHENGMPFPLSIPHSPDTATYSLNGTSYFPHPCGYHDKDTDDRCGSSDNDQQEPQPEPLSRSAGPGEDPPMSVAPTNPIAPRAGTNAGVNAELKISLGAKHLAAQISNSKKVWIAFQDAFVEEVKGIGYYVDDDILQQIWQKRIEYNDKYKNDESQDDEQFSIQQMKLETCLDQINEAARAFTRSRPRSDRAGHDPRHLVLEKIRGTGALVLSLAEKSISSSAACADLVTEASNLEKLVDSEGPEAQLLHRFDRRKARSTSEDEARRSISAEPTAREHPSDQETGMNTEKRRKGGWS